MARQRKKKSVAPDGFPDSAWNKLPETWRSAAASKATDELEKDIIKAVRAMSETTFDMKNDARLKQLQEDLKDLKAGYTEVIGTEKAKMEYCVYLMNTRGTVVDSDSDDDSDDAVAKAG